MAIFFPCTIKGGVTWKADLFPLVTIFIVHVNFFSQQMAKVIYILLYVVIRAVGTGVHVDDVTWRFARLSHLLDAAFHDFCFIKPSNLD